MSYRSESNEEQMILRLPPQLAEQVRKMLRAKQLSEEIEFEFENDNRTAKFKVGKKKYDGYLVDLPCILESHKTLDKTSYYKSGDIGQMLVINDPKDPVPPPADFKSPNGITPATRDIQRRKWRKPPDPAQLREIENEINRLLKPAENETVEILNADDIDDLDELRNTTEIVNDFTPPKTEKIKIKVAEDGNLEPVSPMESLRISTSISNNNINNNNNNNSNSNSNKKQKKERSDRSDRKKKEHSKEGKEVKEKKERREKKEPEKAEVEENGGEKKEKRKKKKKEKEKKEGEEGGDASVPTTEKKKRSGSGKKRERKHKDKTTEAPQVPTSPTAPPAAFPFSNTITQPPPALPQVQVPAAFAKVRISAPTPTPVSTLPAFNAKPFSPPASFPAPVSAPSPAAPLEGGKMTLETQHKKLQGEVEMLRMKVASATNKYNILPNAVLKARFQVQVDEVTEQFDQKSKELAEVERQMSV